MIKFQLTFNDIEAFNKHFVRSNATFIQKYLHWFILFFFVVFAVWNLQQKNAAIDSYLFLIPLVLGIILFQSAFSRYLKKRMLTSYIKKNPNVVGDREFANNDKILVIKINGKDCEYPYDSFIRLDEDKAHFYAYVSEQSAVIIPKRIFVLFSDMPVILEKIKAGIAK